MRLNTISIQMAAATTAGVSTYKTDWRWGDQQHRLAVVASAHASDNFAIVASPDEGTTFVTIATSLSIGANRVTVFDGPWTELRVDKIGTNGAANIKLVF